MRPTPEDWAGVKELFDGAVDLRVESRLAYLEQKCGEDAALRREVESLLASDAQANKFIENPASAIPRELLESIAEEERFHPRQFGAYRTIREIGRGGLGTVYLAARSDETFEKQVAIKLLRRGSIRKTFCAASAMNGRSWRGSSIRTSRV